MTLTAVSCYLCVFFELLQSGLLSSAEFLEEIRFILHRKANLKTGFSAKVNHATVLEKVP